MYMYKDTQQQRMPAQAKFYEWNKKYKKAPRHYLGMFSPSNINQRTEDTYLPRVLSTVSVLIWQQKAAPVFMKPQGWSDHFTSVPS